MKTTLAGGALKMDAVQWTMASPLVKVCIRNKFSPLTKDTKIL